MSHRPNPLRDDAGDRRLTLVPAESGGNADDRPRPTMDAWERQQTFREMVARHLMNGSLTRARRKSIVQYAAMLGINAVLAGRLLEQARRLVEERSVTWGQPADPPLRIAGAEAPLPVASDGSHPHIAVGPAPRPVTVGAVLTAVTLGAAVFGACLVIKSFM